MKYIIYSENYINFVDQYWMQVINFFKDCEWETICIKNQDDINKKIFSKTDIVMYFISAGLFSVPSHYECYKIFWLCDMHNQSSIILNNIAKCDLIITPNSDFVIKRYSYMNNKQYLSLGWGVKEIKSLVFNINPIKKILVSGAMEQIYYPLRVIASNQSKELVEVLQHPGYGKLKHNIIGDDYILQLNKYLCCFCDASILNIILKKIYEILYSGSLLLADLNIKNELKDVGIIENVHCILCDTNNIEEKMKYILNKENSEEIDNIRKNGFKLAKENFTLINHCNNINNKLQNYIK